MERVTLYDFKNDNISVNVVAYFNPEGDLVIDGYDLGSLVEEMKGSRDYEYQIIVEKENLDELAQALDIDLEILLITLPEHFNGNYAFSNFKNFLKEKNIPFKQFYWP